MKITKLLILSAVFFNSIPMQAIVGGKKMDRSELSQVQMVKFSNTDDTESLCTATLVGPKVIILAAHCIIDNEAEAEFSLRGGRSISISKFIIHPDFNKRLRGDGFAAQGDLALGILSDAVTNIEPITLSAKAPSVGETNLILGVGAPHKEIRQYGYMNVYRVVKNEINFVKVDHLNQTTAVGDSGGPVLIKDKNKDVVLVAVNSTGAGIKDRSDKYGPYAKPYMMATYRVGDGTSIDSFITGAVKAQNMQVCGVNLTCKSVKTNL